MPGRTEFGLLGPLLVRRGGVVLAVPAGKQQALLAALLLRAGWPVSVDDLAQALWGSEPPPSARQSLQNYVKRLRKVLEHGSLPRIVTEQGGYRIRAEADELDLSRFESSLTAGREAARAGLWAEAARLLGAGLSLWRGEPLSGVQSEVLAAREVPRLAEMRLQALEDRIDAELHLNRSGELVAELRQLVAVEPLRERLHALLMIALYRDGQQAGALAAYQSARQILIGEVGAEPGPELRGLHQQILAGDLKPASAGPQRGPDQLRQLPVPPAQFTGRAADLAALSGLLGRLGRQPSGTMMISAIDGMPGVGKTALALHLAHLVADRFPDRQLFADLHGYTPGRPPADPADVLAGLLTADGVDTRYLPGDLDGRAAMWRDRMAGRRVLLVLDNAAGSSQVEPLLPGTATCLVLITSRQFLGDLPTATAELKLDVLSLADATKMFLGLAPRAAGAGAQVAELVALCGYLPLAIALLARLFTRHASWTMDDLIIATRARLLTASAESRTVAAAFDLSYRALDRDHRRFFRYLGLHPGTDIYPHAAAALTGLPLELAIAYLDALQGCRLLEESAARRFRMHDLIRHYARGLVADEEAGMREHAVGRLLEYYQHAAQAAGAHVARHALPAIAHSPLSATLPDLSGWDGARAWMTAERSNLVACIEDAAARRDYARQVGLTAAMAARLRSDGPWPQAIRLHTAAAAAARQLSDELGEAGALVQLGDICRLAGDYPGAIRALEQARGLYTGIGNPLGVASALLCLGEVRRSAGDFPDAVSLLKQARGSFAAIGSSLGEANALLVLGTLWQLTGDYPAALQALERSLRMSRRTGSRLGEAEALRNLGAVRNLIGDFPAASRALEQALQVSAALGDRFGEANALACLGLVLQESGDLPRAISVLERALPTFRDIGSRFGEANALCWLGDALRTAGNLPEAARVLHEALEVYREIGSRHGGASALHNLGRVHHATGDALAAEDLLTQARDIYHELGDRLGEAQTLNQIGTLQRQRGEPRSARLHYLRALEISRSIGNQVEEDNALDGIRLGDTL